MRVAQLDRASDYGSEGREFESSHARFSVNQTVSRIYNLSKKKAQMAHSSIGISDREGESPAVSFPRFLSKSEFPAGAASPN